MERATTTKTAFPPATAAINGEVDGLGEVDKSECDGVFSVTVALVLERGLPVQRWHVCQLQVSN